MGGTRMSRSDDAVFEELLSYIPPGWLWPREPGSLLAALLWPMAAGVSILEKMAEDMMPEIDPSTAVLCLPDFERVLGPDPCGRDVSTLPLNKRQEISHARWTGRGGQSLPYYIDLAAKRGVTIEIEEFTLSRAGVLQAGDELVNHPQQYSWVVKLALGEWDVFRAGEHTAGDLLYSFDLSDIECDIRRAKPAHTEVSFYYLEN